MENWIISFLENAIRDIPSSVSQPFLQTILRNYLTKNLNQKFIEIYWMNEWIPSNMRPLASCWSCDLLNQSVRSKYFANFVNSKIHLTERKAYCPLKANSKRSVI